MGYWDEQIQIGSRKYSRFIGGPLDGITDSPFRRLVRDFSPHNLLYTEMRHVGTVVNKVGGPKALNFLQSERPLNFQVAANSTKFIAEACEKITAAGVDMIDLNIGCPARNVVNSGGGSSLMADLPRLTEILREFRRCLPQQTFTIKIRAGYKIKNAVTVAKLAQDCGVDALAIHPRLQTELFAGRPDYALAAEVKRALQIPVILSGNVVNWATAQAAYEQTGVDGYLIGRGLWAKPWKLAELDAYAAQQPLVPLDQWQLLTIAVQHLKLMLAYYGTTGMYCFRKHLPFYLRGFTTAQQLRKTLMVSNDADYVLQTLTGLAIGPSSPQLCRAQE